MAEESFQNKFFDTDSLKSDLKGRSVRGGTVTMAAQGLKFFLQMGSTAILARLLTPQDFGLITMVTAVTGFVMMFKDMGLSMATVQKVEINHKQISTLFWINLIFSFIIMLVTMAIAPAIAWFYKEPRLIWITLVLAGAFIFSGLTIQHQALLRRQMRFRSLAIVEIIAMLAGIFAAVTAACFGAGYWALVIMQLATAITIAIGVWLACEWRPGIPKRHSGIREMLAFGGHLTGFNIINYFARNLDNVLIGKVWGSDQLGFYSKAYGLLLLPIQQITTPISAVAIPALSRLQNNTEKYRRYYYRAVSTIAFITMPFVAILAALSDEIIRIVLGVQWTGASPIFKVLAFTAFFQPVVGTSGWVYVSLGQTKRMMYWAAIVTPIIVLFFIIGLPWGAIGVAISYTVCILTINVVPCLVFAFRYSPISVIVFFKTIWRPATFSLIVYIALELARSYFAFYSVIHVVLCSCIVALFVIVLSLIFWTKLRDEAFNTARILKLLRNEKEF